jgi:hypothetical protein
MRLLLPQLALLLAAHCACAASAPAPTRVDALRDTFATQLEATGTALNALLCATALTGLADHCEDKTASLWANATSANATSSPLDLLQSLIAPLNEAMSSAVTSIAAISDAVGRDSASVATVTPTQQPWSEGSTSAPTYLGQLVSLTPAVHVPAYTSSDAIAQTINADVSMMGGLASKLRELYTATPQPLMVAAMSGATLYMPAPWQAADARTQPWFQGAVLPPRKIIVVCDMWTTDRTSGVGRVAQVSAACSAPAMHVPCDL